MPATITITAPIGCPPAAAPSLGVEAGDPEGLDGDGLPAGVLPFVVGVAGVPVPAVAALILDASALMAEATAPDGPAAVIHAGVGAVVWFAAMLAATAAMSEARFWLVEVAVLRVEIWERRAGSVSWAEAMTRRLNCRGVGMVRFWLVGRVGGLGYMLCWTYQ